MRLEEVSKSFNQQKVLDKLSLTIEKGERMCLLGPSGCGKTTFLRCFNRMNDVIPHCRVTGSIRIDGTNLNSPDVDPVLLRARVGMVFQKANPFPKTIYEIVAYGPRIHGLAANKDELDFIVEDSLQKAGLWAEV